MRNNKYIFKKMKRKNESGFFGGKGFKVIKIHFILSNFFQKLKHYCDKIAISCLFRQSNNVIAMIFLFQIKHNAI